MPWHGLQACMNLGLPRLRLLRPRFCDAASSLRVETLGNVLDSVPAGKRLLVTTGRKETDVFRTRPDLTVHLRSIEPVADLPPNVEPVLMRPPFTQADEYELMRKLNIEVLIAKDSGGVTAPKLAAARELGIDVILLDRPEQPPGPLVQTAEQAVAWLQHVVGIES
jgi:precorrin-6A/cobalt-precorrin-6A reductase